MVLPPQLFPGLISAGYRNGSGSVEIIGGESPAQIATTLADRLLAEKVNLMSHNVWVYIDHFKGAPLQPSWEAVGAARTVATELGTGVAALVFGEGIGDAAQAAFTTVPMLSMFVTTLRWKISALSPTRHCWSMQSANTLLRF